LTVAGQLQQLGGRMVAGPPKSDAGRRVIALDKTTIAALREHRFRQQAERGAAGSRWAEHVARRALKCVRAGSSRGSVPG
jgi:hypothetical protein